MGDRTYVPCTGRWILHDWTAKEVLNRFLKCQETSTIPSTCKLHAQSPSPTCQHHPPQKFSSERWSLIKIDIRRVLCPYFSTNFLNRQYLGYLFLFHIYFNVVELTYNIVLISAVWQSDSFSFFGPHLIACRILVPWPGIEPSSLGLEAWSLNHWTTRKVLLYLYFYFLFHHALSQDIEYNFPCYTVRLCLLTLFFLNQLQISFCIWFYHHWNGDNSSQ